MQAAKRARRRHSTAARPRGKPNVRLPAALLPLFWEYASAPLQWDRDRDLVVGRVLSQGGWKQARLLRSRLGDAVILEWIMRRQGRGLSPQRIRFWELLVGIPAKLADAWVSDARRGSWGGRR